MRFSYLEPGTIEEAISLLHQYDGRAKVMAGGTDLLLQVQNKTVKPEYVVDIGNISGLDHINYDEKYGLKIGAMTTITSLEESRVIRQAYPVISQAARLLGSVAIRNVATIGGNLCNAAPSAEMAPALIGLSSTVKIVGPGGERTVCVEDFFSGPGVTVIKNEELLAEIQVPVPPPHTKAAYLKYRRSAIDLAVVGVAVVITLESDGICRDIKIVLGAVAPTPMRAKKAEEVLRGKRINQVTINRAAEVASDEARPITDVRASAEYRKAMVEVLTIQATKEAMAK